VVGLLWHCSLGLVMGKTRSCNGPCLTRSLSSPLLLCFLGTRAAADSVARVLLMIDLVRVVCDLYMVRTMY
jgi:hypothetical protein